MGEVVSQTQLTFKDFCLFFVGSVLVKLSKVSTSTVIKIEAPVDWQSWYWVTPRWVGSGSGCRVIGHGGSFKCGVVSIFFFFFGGRK